jgi:hypothetical protein
LKWGNVLHQTTGQYIIFPAIEKTVSANATNASMYGEYTLPQSKVFE